MLEGPSSFRTSDIAKAVGIHPNTVRLYEEWGFIPPVPRSSNGYRVFSEFHLTQMRLARLVLHGGWPGRTLRQSALALVKCAASGDLDKAFTLAQQHLDLVAAEIEQAESAAVFLEQWVAGNVVETLERPLHIGDVAQLLKVTTDMVRDWERNGLLKVPRNPTNGYRNYGVAEIGRLRVIRMLRNAGYSTMAILRMLVQLDRGVDIDLREALDTPGPNDDICNTTDQWLSTLAEQRTRAEYIIQQVQIMLDTYGPAVLL